MTFEDEIKDFTKAIPEKLEHIDSEETSKIALITPFLRLMGYDTTNPAEVKAEFTADVGTKQKVKKLILQYCKMVNQPYLLNVNQPPMN